MIKYIDPSCFYWFIVPLGRNLREIRLSHISLSTSVYSFPSNLCVRPTNTSGLLMDLSDNPGLQTFLNVDELKIRGFENMMYLNMENIGMKVTSPKILDHFKQLRSLRFGGNKVVLDKLPANESLFFRNNAELQELSLSRNSLHMVPYYEFARMEKLEILNLSSNVFQNISFYLSNLSSLSCLDLSGNKLATFDPSFRAELDALANKSQQLQIDISNNPLSCGCNDIDFVQWFQQTKIPFLNRNSTWCSHPTLRQVLIETVDPGSLHKACFPPASKLAITAVSITLGVVMFVVLVCSITFVWKRYHWSVRHWVYKRLGPELPTGVKEYKYDAFIVYSSEFEDRHWVHNTLRNEMEDERGLHLCIYMRDLPAGGVLADRHHHRHV